MNRIVAGVYKITNTANGKVYIGSSADLKRRENTHFLDLEVGRHPNRHLQCAFEKYGKTSFVFEVVEEIATLLGSLGDQRTYLRESLLFWEQFYIDQYGCADEHKGYNNSPTAGSILGFNYTQEQKDRARASWTPERRKVWSQRHLGVKRPDVSAALAGRVFSEEHRKHLRETHKGFAGMTHSAETKQRIGASGKIAQNRPEVKAKLRERFSGDGNPAKRSDVRAKISAALKGRSMSDETRAKIAAAARLRTPVPRTEEWKKNIALAVSKAKAKISLHAAVEQWC